MPFTPRIPAEIAFKIIDFGEDGFVDLKSTSLVCKIWRDHSQQCLFRTLHLTVHPTGDNSIRRLEGIELASSVRIRSYIRSLYLTFPPPRPGEDGPDVWLNTHEKLLVQVLKMLDRLSVFALWNDWPIFDYAVKGQTLVPQFPSISRCIEDLCASPTLKGIVLDGTVPVLHLLSRCSPALEDLQTFSLRAPSIPANMEPPSIPIRNRQAIALQTLMVYNPHTAQTANADLLDNLLNPLRSFFDLASLKVLKIMGNHSLDEPLRQLFEACSSTLERLLITFLAPASSSKSSSLSLRKAVGLKSLNLFYGTSMLYQLTDFMDWLLQELASDQKQGEEIHPSILENVTLAVPVYSSVSELDVRQVGVLSDILSDSRQYPKIKEFELVVRYDHFNIKFLDFLASENEHKEKLKSAMGALKERGTLQLHW